MAQYRVAHELRMTVAELQEMSVSEFMHWIAYLKMSDDGNRKS